MKLILKGENCGFTWSASHLLPGHFKCSRMHGHNYVMDVEIDTGKSISLRNGMIVDFVKIKKHIREMIEKYDHRLMLPSYALELQNYSGMNIVNIPYDDVDSYRIKYKGMTDEDKIYSIPASDIVFIEGANFITAEELSRFFKREVAQVIYDIDNRLIYENVYVTIYEDSGQGATS